MERTDNIGFGDLILIQDPEKFSYGIDAVILSDFACSIYPEFKNAVDLGTGNGVIPLILSHKNRNARICGFDIQPDAIDMAVRSCGLNHLEDRLSFKITDISDFCNDRNDLEQGCYIGSYDMVTCNPPYFPKGGAIPSSNAAKFIARHETTATVKEFIKAAALLLKQQGHLFMVHRPSRLVDIFYHCRENGLEPKDIRFVVPRSGETPNIVLIHCIKGGGKELKVLKELSVYDETGKYTEEIEKIYERK